MKSIKLFALLALVSGFADAATVTISSGLAAQGYTVLVNTVAPANFFVSVGSWNSINSTWTQFGSSVSDTAKVGGFGGISATSPLSLNGVPIDVFVGTGTDIASSGTGWVILRQNTSTLFPPDITQATNVTWAGSTTDRVTIVGTGNVENGFNVIGAVGGNLNLVTIPEPSAALLGALGVLGLLRRRRI